MNIRCVLALEGVATLPDVIYFIPTTYAIKNPPSFQAFHLYLDPY